MPTKPTATAFDLKPRELKGAWASWNDLAVWLAQQIDLAQSGRSSARSEIEYNWAYYEQQRMRTNTAPWPDAADLPSPYAPEYTDAVHARLMQSVFVDPVWIVEGWGESAKKAEFVEEFHQRAQEDERLQSYADEWILRGLVEGVGTLEVQEGHELRRERVTKRVALQLDPTTQQPILGEDTQPLTQKDDNDQFIPVQDELTPSAEIELDEWKPVRLGPEYDVIPYLDFCTLPAHARNRKQVWGYAKRFWRRYPELQADAKRGIYDKQACEEVGPENDRVDITDEAPKNLTPVDQQGHTAQKELWEMQCLLDLDGEGERWWTVTLHKDKRTILRCKVDDRTTRYIRWMPFPKPGNVDRGYSLIGNKLITVLEEDTARRNMKADRMALVAGQPIKRLTGALWDPFKQPFGPRAVIDVRDMKEIEAMKDIPDVPNSVQSWGKEIRDDADRLVGQNDVSIGAETQSDRTLGEVQLRSGYAEVRMSVVQHRLHEPMEELGQARHTIWQRTLASNPNLPPQRAMAIGRGAMGVEEGGFPPETGQTAQLLDGVFWFKPYGSVDTADLNRMSAFWVQFLKTIPMLMQINPMIGAVLQTAPAAKFLLEQSMRFSRINDRQSILGSEAMNVFDQMQQQQEMMRDPRMQMLMAAAGAPQGGGTPPMGAGQPEQPPAQPSAGAMLQ